MFCPNCGNNIEGKEAQCPKCGAVINSSELQAQQEVQAPVDAPAQQEAQMPTEASTQQNYGTYTAPEQTYDQAQGMQDVQPKSTTETKPVSTAAYFFLLPLFLIPFVGFVLSIVLSCAPKNVSLKHFARAILIWQIIDIVLAIAIIVLVAIFSPNELVEYLWGVQYLN